MFPIHDDTERIHGRPYVNYFLIAINIIVFVWEVIATGYFSDQQAIKEISNNYGAIPISILKGDLLSILTSMFLHGGIAHLIGNMVFLFVFGDNIEDRFGHIKYLLIYILWGATAESFTASLQLAQGEARYLLWGHLVLFLVLWVHILSCFRERKFLPS